MAFHDEEPVEFVGGSLTLAIDFRVIDLIEHCVGEKMPAIMAQLGRNPATGVVAKIVWAMTRRHHPDLKLDLVGALLLGENRGLVADAMCSLLARAMNIGEAKAKGGQTVEWNLHDFLVEWISLGGRDDRFWAQTPKSYVAAMEGMARAASRQVDLAITNGWHAALFALNGYSGQLKGKRLSDYLTSKPEKRDDQALINAQGIHFFQSLKAKGMPIDITVTRH